MKPAPVPVDEYYRTADGKTSSEAYLVRYVIGQFIDLCGTLPAEEFGPLKLAECQSALESMTRPASNGENVESRYARKEINRRVGIWKRAIKWGVENERVPYSVLGALQTVTGLKKYKSIARETEKVTPVDEQHVLAVLPYASPVVADMMQLQMLTGMRSGELVIMRPCDVDRTGPLWIYRPPHHKTAHIEDGRTREIGIGPQGQQILEPYLSRPLQAYCFSPIESTELRLQKNEMDRTAPHSPGRNCRGSNRVANPQRHPGARYTTASYRKSVQYAIDKCNKERKKCIAEAESKGLKPAISLSSLADAHTGFASHGYRSLWKPSVSPPRHAPCSRSTRTFSPRQSLGA